MTRQHAAAYLRRSSVSSDSPGDASKEAQTEATRRLAGAFAPTDELVEYVDWGVSGRKDDRPGYVRLKNDIEAGKVSHVFAYSLSRLGRSNVELATFFLLCKEKGVKVTSQAEGQLSADSAMGEFLLNIMSAMAHMESSVAQERTNSAIDVKRRRGDDLGRPIFGFHTLRVEPGDNGAAYKMVHVPDPDQAGDVQKIIAAVEEAGPSGILGACKILNRQGRVIPPRGGRWVPSALTRVVRAHAPHMLERRRASGRPAGPALFLKLLRCHCQATMTPNVRRGQYYCAPGSQQGVATHGRAHVREVDLMPWIMRQARQHAEAGESEAKRQAAERRTAELMEKRRRLGYAVMDDLMDRAEAKAVAKEIDDELRSLADDLELLTSNSQPIPHEYVITEGVTGKPLPANQLWDADTIRAMNTHYRAMWRHVQLDQEMRPTAVEWR